MKVSVIIPAYNCEKYISQTLDCICAQTMPRKDIEVIVCLDAPTDGTAAAVRGWVEQNPGLHVLILENKKNQGVSKTRNNAVRHASGEFIHFMDADDILNADFYRALYDAAKQARADVAVASYRHMARPSCSVIFDNEIVVTNPQDKIDVTHVDEHGMMWRYLIRREFWNKNKFAFPLDMRVGEDWLLANKMIYSAGRIVAVPGAMYLYIYRQNSVMGQIGRSPELQTQGERARQSVEAFLSAHNLTPHQRMASVSDVRLFGAVRIFTLENIGTTTFVRLFGKWTLFKIVRNAKFKRGV